MRHCLITPGVPIIDLTFDGPYGVYHSAYDNFYWMNHFGDPGYRYQTLMAQLWGVLVLRLANADLLPFDFSSYGAHVRQYLDTLATQHSLNLLDLGPLRTSIDTFERAGQALEATKGVALQSGRLDPMLADQLNRGVMGLERNFLAPDGIPDRPWYKHIIYACRQTYAHLELPGLTEAVESGDWARAQQQAGRLEAALRTNSVLLTQLNHDLACAGGFAQKNTPACTTP